VVALAGSLAGAERRAEVRAALAHCRVVPQRGATFAARLVAAHADAAYTDAGGSGPVIQLGMDTPQLGPALLDEAGCALGSCDAVLGPACDGGWWALGVHDPRQARVLAGVPMSTRDTGALTLRALRAAGLRVTLLPELSDVDTMEDAERVAEAIPGSAGGGGTAGLRRPVRFGPAGAQDGAGPSFPWCRVGADAVTTVAGAADLRLVSVVASQRTVGRTAAASLTAVQTGAGPLIMAPVGGDGIDEDAVWSTVWVPVSWRTRQVTPLSAPVSRSHPPPSRARCSTSSRALSPAQLRKVMPLMSSSRR
jgi:glycosyltransferase A (GT-A) superfamily protein (DUF2064 family)